MAAIGPRSTRRRDCSCKRFAKARLTDDDRKQGKRSSLLPHIFRLPNELGLPGELGLHSKLGLHSDLRLQSGLRLRLRPHSGVRLNNDLRLQSGLRPHKSYMDFDSIASFTIFTPALAPILFAPASTIRRIAS